MPSTVGFIAGLGQVRLTLELTPQNTPAGGDILAVAIFTTERNPMPIEGQTITFYLGPNEAASQASGADGRTTYTFTGLSFGTHAVSVQIAGVHVTQRHTLTKPAEEATADLLVEPSGRNGKYNLTVTVLSAKGVGMPRRTIRIQDPQAEARADRRTDKHGTYVHRIVFTDRERFVTVLVPGTKLSKTVRLFGPREQGGTNVSSAP